MSEQKHSASDNRLDLTLILKNFWHLFRRTWLLVILAAVIFGAFSGYRAYRSYSPYYEAEAVISVSSGYTATVDILNRSSYYDSGATKQVISTFQDIINTDAMREMILQDLDADYINGSIATEIIANSNLFTLSVRSGNAQDAYDILIAVMDNYPRIASLVIGNAALTMVQPPVVPTTPVNVRNWKGAATSGAASAAMVTLVLITLLSQLRKTIRSADDMKQYTNLTCLGLIPVVPQRRRKSGSSSPSLLRSNLPSSYAEAIRTLRTRLLHRLNGKGKIIMVTSTAPSEGKSTISSNLALALAQAGSSVILVDADMRVQSLQEFFGLKGKFSGLPELLAGTVTDLDSCLQSIPGTSLRLLGSSSNVASPSKLLRSARIQKILQVLQSRADYVIIDTPPIGLLADAASFARLVDGVIYVVREDYASRSDILNCLQSVSDSQANIIGYVLNGTAQSNNRYGYGSSYGGYGKYGKSAYDAYGSGK